MTASESRAVVVSWEKVSLLTSGIAQFPSGNISSIRPAIYSLRIRPMIAVREVVPNRRCSIFHGQHLHHLRAMVQLRSVATVQLATLVEMNALDGLAVDPKTGDCLASSVS